MKHRGFHLGLTSRPESLPRPGYQWYRAMRMSKRSSYITFLSPYHLVRQLLCSCRTLVLLTATHASTLDMQAHTKSDEFATLELDAESLLDVWGALIILYPQVDETARLLGLIDPTALDTTVVL